jgi:hypothetical protein
VYPPQIPNGYTTVATFMPKVPKEQGFARDCLAIAH